LPDADEQAEVVRLAGAVVGGEDEKIVGGRESLHDHVRRTVAGQEFAEEGKAIVAEPTAGEQLGVRLRGVKGVEGDEPSGHAALDVEAHAARGGLPAQVEGVEEAAQPVRGRGAEPEVLRENRRARDGESKQRKDRDDDAAQHPGVLQRAVGMVQPVSGPTAGRGNAGIIDYRQASW
jgi:hypothetical protein